MKAITPENVPRLPICSSLTKTVIAVGKLATFRKIVPAMLAILILEPATPVVKVVTSQVIVAEEEQAGITVVTAVDKVVILHVIVNLQKKNATIVEIKVTLKGIVQSLNNLLLMFPVITVVMLGI